MKLFEITQINEIETSQLSRRVQSAITSLSNKIQFLTDPNVGGQNADDTDDARAARNADTTDGVDGEFDAEALVADAAAKIRSGEAKLSKDIDAELGKRGANPQDIHIAIMGKVQDAASSLVSQIGQQGNLRRSQINMLRSTTDMDVQAAAFGYINKKYLNGSDFSDGNFNFQTMDLITQALRSQAPVGGNQAVGRVSSSRPQGQNGTVGSGQGTNALDAMAADQDF